MKKNLEKLIEKFKKVESELVESLKNEGIDIDFDRQKAVVKKSLKEYIKKVNKAKKLFDEYESLAKQIEDASSDDEDLPELSKVVLELRDASEIQQLSSEVTENKPQKNSKNSKTSKQKKKNIEPVKEF